MAEPQGLVIGLQGLAISSYIEIAHANVILGYDFILVQIVLGSFLASLAKKTYGLGIVFLCHRSLSLIQKTVYAGSPTFFS